MDNAGALIAAALVLIIIIFLLNILKKEFDSGGKQDEAPVEAEEVQVGRRAVGARQNRAGLRNRGALRQQHQGDQPRNQEEEGSDEEAPAASPLLDLGDMKVGKKKLAKLEAKAEKKAAREAEEKEREERMKKDLEEREERRKREELEEQLEKEKEEQLKREIAEKERQEYEAYLQLKASFVVEEEGCDAQENVEDNLLQRFVDHVKASKIVLLEELAAIFQLKMQDAIDRLQKLVADGTLTGVIDDRGKFIYISKAEMESVAKFIRQRGRVSLSDLAESSNQLIQLASPNQAVDASA
nr:EOG090X0N9E [Sida crystallina]